MSITPARPRSLSERQTDMTRSLILQSALELLERGGDVTGLTNRTIAETAGISERTVYRHFATRDELLDALAGAYSERVQPPLPETIEGLRAYPRALFPCFERERTLTLAALHPELFHRLRKTQAQARWEALRRLLHAHAPHRPAQERERAAANLRYLLSATAWNYYRHYFGFSLAETEAAACQAIEAELLLLSQPLR